jgi:FkbM family methyltransferase
VASPWIGDPPSAWNGRNFEGITLPKSIYDPNKPWGPTKYRAPRAVHPLLYYLGADMDRYNYFEQFSHVKDAVVVEIGAWDGENTLTIGSMPNVKTVYTFEATPNKMDGIRQKMAPVANKVKLINAAVTNYTGSATLYVPPTAQGMQDSIGPQKYHLGDVNTIQVPAVRLDDVVKEHVDYIVTDTQGNEFHVLLGAEKLIDEYGVDAIRFEWIPKMAANNNENLGDMLHYLHDKGYMCMDSKSAPIPFGPGVDRSYSNYPYLYATNNGANYQGSWTDLLCIKVR